MGLDLLLDAVEHGDYDPELTRIDVALRAIWLLYLRDKRDLLAEAGIEWAALSPVFWEYGELNGREPLKRGKQTLEFLRYVRTAGRPEALLLLSAALWMIGAYMNRRRRMRASWYGRTLYQEKEVYQDGRD